MACADWVILRLIMKYQPIRIQYSLRICITYVLSGYPCHIIHKLGDPILPWGLDTLPTSHWNSLQIQYIYDHFSIIMYYFISTFCRPRQLAAACSGLTSSDSLITPGCMRMADLISQSYGLLMSLVVTGRVFTWAQISTNSMMPGVLLAVVCMSVRGLQWCKQTFLKQTLLFFQNLIHYMFWI